MQTTITTHGLKQLLIELKQLEPELHKALRKELVSAARPLAVKVGSGYPTKPLDNWSTSKRVGLKRMPPYRHALAVKGVKPVYATSTNRSAILRIAQSNAGGQVYDSAGGKSQPSFVVNLDKHLGTKSRRGRSRSRVLYAGVKQNIRMIDRPIAEVINRLEDKIQRKIAR
jgi:hypothetical protein